ncbi:uncharacterized protein LOC125649713 isoform X1 [Ostrea edulis]|uniref:uncharacterized protein LOC125649713 isoform X1 n=1 Tax=Ostrea edulis TaxID=37623 RepID=UPI002094CE1E|nr:uncharacterized protein LOC125649713 isoform X1 [Ostrea edulis]
MEVFRMVELGTEIVTYLMMISGIPACIAVYKSKDPNKMNYVFCLLGLLNAFAGIVYGQLLQNNSLITINWVCAVFQAVFVLTIILVSQPKSKPMTQATMAGLGLLTFYQYLIHVVVHEKAILNMLGMFMFAVATITWATPALEIRECMKKQSSADISISMLIGGIACASMWLVYGLMLDDFFIYSPNVIGLTTSAGKVMCLMKYSSKKKAA